MRINEHLKKNFWVRRLNDGGRVRMSHFAADDYQFPDGDAKQGEWYLTQEDFMQEIEQSAHSVNSSVQSKRPVYEQYKDPKTGKTRWRIKRYDDVEVTTLGCQKRFATTWTSHMAADGLGLANETKNFTELYDTLCSWKDTVGIDSAAWLEIVWSCACTGDAAIYLYVSGGQIEYKVFSYLYGDSLYHDLDENRNPITYRKYRLKGKTAVDVYASDYVETWVLADPEQSDADQTWWNKVKNWFGRINTVVSEDGYVRIYRKESQTPSDMNQCIYFRINDIRSGSAQLAIEGLERSCSYVSEEVKSTAFPMLMLKAVDIAKLPPFGAHGKTIGIKGTADDLGKSDAKYLAPPDASNIATLDITNKWNNIVRSTMSVIIEPDILKSGADSSTTIKIMYAPEIQYCQVMWAQFFKPVKQMLAVFKELVGKVEGKSSEYAKLRISTYQKIWIPQNDAENADIATKLVYAGVLSQANARSFLDLQYLNDANLVDEEKKKDLYIKNYVPIQAKAEAEAKYGTTTENDANTESDGNDSGDDAKSGANVDNNASNRDIARDTE